MRARVIAATNQNLAALVQRGRFRADVYFRLNVLHLRIPPLRERLDDLPLLVRAGLARLAARLEIDEPRISGAFLRRLAEHEWPGNVRELFNTLERLVVRGRGTPLEAEALDDLLGEPAQTPDAPGDLLPGDLADRERIAVALRRTGGNVSRAARQLGVGREKLRYRIRKYRLDHLLAKD
jgi:DNA-binding NtrC family response regulator